jgi:mannose-1-phosphate guanylyltransferase
MRKTVAEQAHTSAWAILLAGGDGTRLQSLTRKLAGDSRPKQFSRLFGGRSLLGHTRARLRPIFGEDRTMFVVTRAHEAFYSEDLTDVDASRVIAQPANRGTGTAISLALLHVLHHDADPVIAFFPSDHYFADDAAFAATVQSAVCLAKKYAEVILIGAQPRWAEVDYGWIEPGVLIADEDRTPLLRVNRFWEKPPFAKARELMQRGGLWNTFITVGHASAFLELLISTIPASVAEIAAALRHGDLDAVYRELEMVDFSMAVLSREPHRLLVLPDAASGWADLGNPERVIDTLNQNQIEPQWLREMWESPVPSAAPMR